MFGMVQAGVLHMLLMVNTSFMVIWDHTKQDKQKIDMKHCHHNAA